MSLRVWLPLNGDLHNQGLSSYNISMLRGSAIFDNNGKIGKCFHANGVNTIKIENIIPDFYNYSGYSLCAWFYIESQNTSHSGSGIISAGNWNNQILNLALSDWSTDHYTRLQVSGTSWNKIYNYTFNKNTWYHVVVSSDGNKTYAYVNGVLIGDTVAGFLPTSIEGNNIAIGGATYYSGMQFFGKINDVRIYDHALSAKEVEEIAKGLVLHYKLDQPNQNLLTNDWDLTAWSKESGISVSWDNTIGMYKVLDSSHTSSRWGIYQNITLSANTTYTFSVDGMKKDQNVNFGFAEGTSWPANAGSFTTTMSRLSKTITVGDADANCRIYLNINPVTDGSNYGYFRAPKLEIGSVATNWKAHTENIIYDSSGYSNNGTIAGSLETVVPSPRYEIATQFPGTTFIKKENFQIGNIWTLSCWFYSPSSSSHTWSPLVILNNTGGDSDSKFSIYYNQSTGVVQFLANGVYDITQSTTKNAWHHLVSVYDGSILYGYIDGIQKTSKSISNTELNKTNLGIGARCTGTGFSSTSTPFEGNLSDVRIYATAFTPEQIKELYNTSMSIDNKGNIYARELVEL